MGTAKVNNPDSINCTLSFTMSLKDWKQVRKTLRTNTAYAELQVINEIQDLVLQLEKVYYPETE